MSDAVPEQELMDSKHIFSTNDSVAQPELEGQQEDRTELSPEPINVPLLSLEEITSERYDLFLLYLKPHSLRLPSQS